uniref:Uncharacterized protein n=1 Tax=Eutreptiella gymnastica TaxID=73025 RepID=A0A7S1INI3_9EUGL
MAVLAGSEGHNVALLAPISTSSTPQAMWLATLAGVATFATVLLVMPKEPATLASYSTTTSAMTNQVARSVTMARAPTSQVVSVVPTTSGVAMDGQALRVSEIPRAQLLVPFQRPEGRGLPGALGTALLGSLVALVGLTLHRMIVLNQRIAMAMATTSGSPEDTEAKQPVVCPNCDKCDGSGRIMGGIAALPYPFSLWPIKVYRPCPNLKGEYQRVGQSLNDLAGGTRAPQGRSPSPNAGKVVKVEKTVAQIKDEIEAPTSRSSEPPSAPTKGFGKK